MYTMQEAFEKGAKHLIKQGKQSSVQRMGMINAQRRLYRQNGTAECPIRCVVGAFIPDELYREQFEDEPAEEIARKFPEIFQLANYSTFGSNQFWKEFQLLHDNKENWKSAETLTEALYSFGYRHNLNLGFLGSENV